ncbi:unnamed protein product [Linum tenue]|uniref:Uncharacterized protein n=1 Tax=Linum tenue TaxID=586396 RepID=A0AAV0JFV2_9ROSI|nr:unnamed protein product [Linum tenue]
MAEPEEAAEKSKAQNPHHQSQGQPLHHHQQQYHSVFVNSAPAMLGRDRGESLMEVDLDLDNSWPLDQISYASSHPMSPLFLSSSDPNPCSPLWAFPDADDDKLPPAAAPRDYPIFVTCNISSATETKRESDEGKKIPPSPRWGSMPIESPDGHCLIKERMTRALRYLKESTEQHILAQVWAPVKNQGRFVLTTSEQPFVLDPHCNGLNQYRMVSLLYTFSVDGETDGELGLPGRVFQQKLPEWTPNVQYYSRKEYSRLGHALHYNVQGTLALPVFETSGKSCVGVVELVMTSQKINYGPEVDKVCKALEAVDLKSSQIMDHPSPQICNEGRQNALAEILEILTVVCETHNLPLAQTWVPCMHRNVLAHGGGVKKSCTSFDGSCNGQVCMSTTDLASYIVDAQVWGFREACREHHLQTGQGVAGRAFLSHNACFCRDIRNICKTQYPLVHYARMFGLSGCFAICLKSSHTGDDDYVLEFFLPPGNAEGFEQKKLLGLLLATMKQHFQSFRVASGMEFGDEEEVFVEIIEASETGKLEYSLECIRVPHADDDALPKEMEVVQQQLQYTSLKRQPSLELNENGPKIPLKKKRGKTEKSISLEVLQQHFAGSLKDAAKSLGVCPTTMKRICRQHGISRWPSRKINKVNRSLTKLKRVIESVQELPQGLKSGNASREDSAGNSTSHGSCQGSPANGESGPPAKDPDEHSPKPVIRGEAKKVIIKAMYKEDIIRFRISAGCGLMELKEEVGKRLKLDIGVFDIKYLDDDNEWVLIVCDADLQECIDITRSSSRCNMIRLSIHDVSANFGSSCESTGGGLR